MRKIPISRILILTISISCFITFLNINFLTQKCTDYKCQTIKIPLYLKIIDFFDRHYNYRQLVKTIVQDVDTDTESVLKIFGWTTMHIRPVPYGFPIIDDHVWHIIVRGYGTSDQCSDVFTTLCNYAGIKAFYSYVYTKDRIQRIPLSFVKIKEKWIVFDPYSGVYFKNKNNELADIEILKSDIGWMMECLKEKPDTDYEIYFTNLPLIKDIGLRRANIQSPVNRLIFEIKRRIRWFKNRRNL